MSNNNEQNEQQVVELLEPVTDEKPIINKTKLLINNLKDSRKNKKYILGFIGVLVLIIATVLFISMSKKMNFGPQVNDDGTINVETGTKWGDTYALFAQKELVDLDTYDVALIDLDFNKTPEMLVKYTDKYGKDTLKIFFITEGEVFSSKYYHLYSLHLLYSLETKDVGWYIHIQSTGDYGAYTSLDKMINGEAFDSDIKTSTEKLLEDFKKSYVDAKHKIVFYQINKDNFVEDIKTVVSRYSTYEKSINNSIKEVKEKNKDKEFSPVVEEVTYDNVEHLIFNGKKIKFGTYAIIDDEGNVDALSVNRNGYINCNGELLKFVVNYNGLALEDGTLIKALAETVLVYDEKNYYYYMDEYGNFVEKTEVIIEEDTNLT